MCLVGLTMTSMGTLFSRTCPPPGSMIKMDRSKAKAPPFSSALLLFLLLLLRPAVYCASGGLELIRVDKQPRQKPSTIQWITSASVLFGDAFRDGAFPRPQAFPPFFFHVIFWTKTTKFLVSAALFKRFNISRFSRFLFGSQFNKVHLIY